MLQSSGVLNSMKYNEQKLAWKKNPNVFQLLHVIIYQSSLVVI